MNIYIDLYLSIYPLSSSICSVCLFLWRTLAYTMSLDSEKITVAVTFWNKILLFDF